jgi:hypothetical protein
MDNSIMPLQGEFAPVETRDWEAKIFRQVCAEAQEEAAAHLALDEALFAQRPAGWRVVGFRERLIANTLHRPTDRLIPHGLGSEEIHYDSVSHTMQSDLRGARHHPHLRPEGPRLPE